MNPYSKTTTLAALAGLVITVGSAQAATIYSETFTDPTGMIGLNGTEPDTTTGANTWASSPVGQKLWTSMRGIEVAAISFFFLSYSYKRIVRSGGRGLADEHIHFVMDRVPWFLNRRHMAGIDHLKLVGSVLLVGDVETFEIVDRLLLPLTRQRINLGAVGLFFPEFC